MNLDFFSFFFTFRKKWVGRAMGNETFYWDGLIYLMYNLDVISLYPIESDLLVSLIAHISYQK